MITYGILENTDPELPLGKSLLRPKSTRLVYKSIYIAKMVQFGLLTRTGVGPRLVRELTMPVIIPGRGTHGDFELAYILHCPKMSRRVAARMQDRIPGNLLFSSESRNHLDIEALSSSISPASYR